MAIIRATRLQERLQAFVELSVARDSSPKTGPLASLPYAAKDLFFSPNHQPRCGLAAAIEPDRQAYADALHDLDEAGAVCVGFTAMTALAYEPSGFNATADYPRNPWNCDFIPGGSSSGSAVSVAAGMSVVALGSDTGGSIRGPAALCGIVGMKPTYGLVSRAGVYANSFTFDHAGPMTWTVEDCAILLQAIAGHDPKDPGSADCPIPDYRAALTGDVRGLRIGIVRHLYEDDNTVTPEVRAALEEAYAVFRSLGATLEDVRIRPAADYYAVKITIAESEQYAIHEEELRTRPGDFGADFLGRALPAVLYSAADYVQAQRERRLMLGEMASIYEKFDVLVTPTAPGPAPRLGTWRTISFWQNSSLTTPFNVTGGPALAQCMGFTPAGLPLSLQLVGRPFDESTVLRAAHAYETATNWRSCRPSLDPGVAFSTKPPPSIRPEPDNDPAVRDIVVAACRRADLSLNDSQIDTICAAAPYVMAMTRRLRRERDFREEPANIFRFPE